uniref:C2 domain-containing protein 2 n=2 Tax=Lygus hesperus TaxID=30085 RepID=A0A0K8SUS5_LYGHE
MADLIPQPIWNWLVLGWRTMEDLADKIDDLICTFEGGGDTTMDTVAMYVFGWMLLVLVVLGLGRFAYGKFVSRTKDEVTGDVAKAASPPPASPVKSDVPALEPPKAKESTPKPAMMSGGGGRAAPTSKRYVPPTPPTRKRLGSVRSSPGPVVRSKPANYVPPPTATGSESVSVKWVNDLFSWLYSDLVVVNEALAVWIASLNEFTKKSVAEHGVGVEFVRVLPESSTPSITNVFCECASNDDVTITCDCEATPALQLKVFRQKGEKIEVSHYRLNVNKFRARLSIFAVSEKLLFDIKCDGWPEVKVALAPVGAIKNNLDETQLQDVINEIVTTALRSSDVHCNFSNYPTCPRLSRYVPSPGHILPLHYDSILTSGEGTVQRNRRLLVKVIKAQGLGGSETCVEPYCVVEVDDPVQKNQTSTKKGTPNPVWEEHFLFELNNMTSEILLEVYDKRGADARFLGLGIVSMDELNTTPSQRQTISLQSTPGGDEVVSGTLTVEFLLIEGADLPMTGDRPYKIKETLRSISPSGQLLTKTTTTFATDKLTNGGDGITDSALREIERSRGTPANKSTLIIHSVQRPGNSPPQADQSPSSPEASEGERGRSRRKKRDFFGTLRRFGRSKTRSRSVGPGTEDDAEAQAAMARSISADRARDPSAHSTVPGVLREGSARSSLSEASGISGASSRTYVNEASTLVLETFENSIKKYYLVPLSIAQRNKWKKKGTKLHIFNDHTFIAKHLPGGTMCQVCRKGLPRRIGKQGYECRDCQHRCHKHCHVKVETTCPNSNIHSLELCTDPQSPYAVRKLLGKAAS